MLKMELNILLFHKILLFFWQVMRIITTCHTEWNAKIVVLKKTPLQLYFKTFIEKINSGNLIM